MEAPHGTVDVDSPALWAKVHRIADRLLAHQRAHPLLDPDSLFSDIALRLLRQRAQSIDEHQFLCLARILGRRILVEESRRRDVERVCLRRVAKDSVVPADSDMPQHFDIAGALSQLNKAHPLLGHIVDLHLIKGMPLREVARELGMSSRTIDREWSTARAEFRHRLFE